MDIKDFVKTILLEVIGGVKEAQEDIATNKTGGIINPSINWEGRLNAEGDLTLIKPSQIEMSIAVTVSSADTHGGKFGLAVAGFSTEFNSGESKLSNSTISTVRFTVPVIFPAGKVTVW